MAMESFPWLKDPIWEDTSEKGIEVKLRTTLKSEFDITENIIDVIRVCNSYLVLNAMSEILSIPKLLPDPFF